MHLAAADAALHDLVPALEHLAATLEAASDRTGDVVKAGRTHLMDATPVTLGQELGGYAAQVRRGVERLRAARAPGGGGAAGRHSRGHRDQHAARLRRRGDRGAGGQHGPAAD